MRLTSELAEDTIRTYGKSRVETCFNTLYQEMDMFIKNSGFSEFLTVNQDLLAMAVNDYFFNMNKIRQFYRINHVDDKKLFHALPIGCCVENRYKFIMNRSIMQTDL